MQLKVIPQPGLRYWLAMATASMCGANLGDIIPDVLNMKAAAGLSMLAMMFALLLVVERAVSGEFELFYWIAILIVRAAATNIADYAIDVARLTYTGTAVVLTLILIAAVALDRDREKSAAGSFLPSADGLYWFTMLMAGSLGTVIADGLGHAFGPVQTGVPISASMATLGVLAVMAARSRLGSAGIASYWIAVVAIRWWGTNVGDICAYFLSLPASTATTAAGLTVLLLVLRTRPARRNASASSLPRA
ncbi:hypothetical protein [Paraburkholderia silvatlantica]|uniref:hypothetical protein n=1 Tax=Paraburkholderia silvatlantica TaxID=321895 RepID=UPI00375002B0